jgi:hypothetical protein
MKTTPTTKKTEMQVSLDQTENRVGKHTDRNLPEDSRT